MISRFKQMKDEFKFKAASDPNTKKNWFRVEFQVKDFFRNTVDQHL